MDLTSFRNYLAQSFGFAAISDGLAVVEVGGFVRVMVASRLANAVATQEALPTATPMFAASTTSFVLTQSSSGFVALQENIDQIRMFVFSNASDSLRAASVASTGVLGRPGKIATGVGDILGVTMMEVLEFGTTDIGVLVQRGMAGLQIYNMASNGAMSFVTSISDTPKTYLTEISDLASFGSGGDRVLLALSGVDHGMTSFRISSTGASEVVDSIGPREGLYISGAQMLQVAQVAGQNFAVLAASGSDSLSVVRINPMGVFFVTDHMIDDRQTRFANVSALDMFEANGRMFVVAAGNDSGFSILELLPGGILSQFQTHVRETGTSLGAVTAIEAKVIGASVFVFMTQSDGTQVQQFELTLANLGLAITAQAGGTTLGTALNDRLFGSALGDTLQGAGGADWLHDGLGVDQLSGGGGADVFVFASDGALDRITDFEMGIDRLDMSAWGRIYSASAFDIQSTLNGAEISFGQERVILISANGQSLNPLSFTDADFLF